MVVGSDAVCCRGLNPRRCDCDTVVPPGTLASIVVVTVILGNSPQGRARRLGAVDWHRSSRCQTAPLSAGLSACSVTVTAARRRGPDVFDRHGGDDLPGDSGLDRAPSQS
jgi:hypothetical protein